MTVAEIKEMIGVYMQAEKDLLLGKSVTFNGETVSSEDLDKIRAGRREWERRLNQSTSKSSHSLASFSQ